VKDRHSPNHQLDSAPPPARRREHIIVTHQGRSRKALVARREAPARPPRQAARIAGSGCGLQLLPARSVRPQPNDLDALDLSAGSGADRVSDAVADRQIWAGVPMFVTRSVSSTASPTCDTLAMVWLRFAQSQAPDPVLPESSSWDWLLSVGVLVAVVAVLGCVAIYLVRSRRLAAQAISEVRDLRSSMGESGPAS
jgi:hypothetical protein